jgi:hypothetical protein
MTRIGSLLTIAALGLAAPLAGQGSRSADATAQVVITPSFSLTKMQDLNFGSHFASDGVIETGNANFAVWKVKVDPNTDVADIQIAFTALPSQLTRVGGGDVPISYGTTSGSVGQGGTTGITFNPPTGLASGGGNTGSNGIEFDVRLGAPNGNGASDLVSVDLTGKPAGTYSATITLTITVL